MRVHNNEPISHEIGFPDKTTGAQPEISPFPTFVKNLINVLLLGIRIKWQKRDDSGCVGGVLSNSLPP